MGASVPTEPDVGKPVNKRYWEHYEWTSQFEGAERIVVHPHEQPPHDLHHHQLAAVLQDPGPVVQAVDTVQRAGIVVGDGSQ